MAGVSLVTADNWIITHFASAIGGAVSLMSYAKQLFQAPMAMLAQAAGAASMPFFASLWTRDRRYEFATGVADSVSRVASLGLLAASGMVALGWPAIDLVFTGGRFSPPMRASAASTSRSFPSPCFSGRRRPFTRAPSTPRETPLRPWLPAPSSPWSRYLSITRSTTGAAQRVWRSPPTWASPSRPSPSPCSCTSGAWFRSPVWITRRWAAACWPHSPAGSALGCWPGGSPFSRAICPPWPRSIMPAPGPMRHFLLAGVIAWTLIAGWTLKKSGSALPRIALRRLGLG